MYSIYNINRKTIILPSLNSQLHRGKSDRFGYHPQPTLHPNNGHSHHKVVLVVRSPLTQSPQPPISSIATGRFPRPHLVSL